MVMKGLSYVMVLNLLITEGVKIRDDIEGVKIRDGTEGINKI